MSEQLDLHWVPSSESSPEDLAQWWKSECARVKTSIAEGDNRGAIQIVNQCIGAGNDNNIMPIPPFFHRYMLYLYAVATLRLGGPNKIQSAHAALRQADEGIRDSYDAEQDYAQLLSMIRSNRATLEESL